MSQSSPGLRKILFWIVGGVLLAIIFAVLSLLVFSPRGSFVTDPRFVIISPPELKHSDNETMKERLVRRLMEIQQRFSKPGTRQTFSGGATNWCAIDGLLSQCAHATGKRYVVSKDISGGMVRFGHSKPLNGLEWAAAFTDTLQNGRPEWTDSKTQKRRTENLVVITNDSMTVLVVSPEMASEFR